MLRKESDFFFSVNSPQPLLRGVFGITPYFRLKSKLYWRSRFTTALPHPPEEIRIPDGQSLNYQQLKDRASYLENLGYEPDVSQAEAEYCLEQSKNSPGYTI